MSEDRQERFAAYVEALAEVIGHADRAALFVIIAWACCCRANARASSRSRR